YDGTSWRSSSASTPFQWAKSGSKFSLSWATPTGAGTTLSWVPAFTVGSTGQVGINNQNPAYQLDVTGTARVGNQTSLSSGNGLLVNGCLNILNGSNDGNGLFFDMKT